ncbi:glycosyltransferase family 2 protein [Aneurinibacillus uraniidurans]|uniref:glycosyltransferase family 2 protein n=1 Tax=Aneurinibacillus uraniidurans TaxID=2966586 RepID=UPI00234A5F96|nr:TPR domain-containing glycosyltransferase [Aneurinibacillus sp. B1]WCN37469.1 glycosyltransferase [Aneurinibacillus sp. B1]
MNDLRLSLCMIVKDEEASIGRCLSSVKGIVDEIIIVDTGSTDRTVEICQSFGAHVHSFAWNESFADARNYGLARATGDWILWLDADEEVDANDRDKLRDSRYFHEYDVLQIQLINYVGNKVDEDKALSIGHFRLFRNNKGFAFVNKIHEWLNIDKVLSSPEDQKRIGSLPIKFHHYGYLDDVVENKNKFTRNLEMLKKELEEEERSPWIHYHIAAEYHRAKQYEKAFEHVNLAVVDFLMAGFTPPSLLYKLKYSILLTLGSWDGALEGIKRALILYPDYVDLQFYQGVILYGKEMYEEALEAFARCIDLGEDNFNYLIMKGLGSFQAWHCKGHCYEKLGQTKEAALSYIRSFQLSPEYTPAIESLADLLQGEKISLQDVVPEDIDVNTLIQAIQSQS